MLTDGIHKNEEIIFESWENLKEELFNFWLDCID
jgi:hypothetical protein